MTTARQNADGDGNQAADQADAQRNTAAVEQAGEHVAPDAVRAQNVLGAGGAVLVNHAIFLVVLCQRVVGADFVRKYCQQNQHKEDDEADDRQLVAAEFLRRAPHGAFALDGTNCILAHGHSPFPLDTRMRGSATV